MLPMENNAEELSFEMAMQQLEELVKQLENIRLPLEEAITAFEKGAKLKQHCEKKLTEAKLRIEQIQGSQSPETT